MYGNFELNVEQEETLLVVHSCRGMFSPSPIRSSDLHSSMQLNGLVTYFNLPPANRPIHGVVVRKLTRRTDFVRFLIGTPGNQRPSSLKLSLSTMTLIYFKMP
ncbi:hypothetical protein ABKN59_010753 [Abortiporus biennis]